MTELFRKTKSFFVSRNITRWVIFMLVVYIVLIIKFITFKQIYSTVLLGVYSMTVTFYILSRFALGFLYKPDAFLFDPSYEPTLSFGVPSKNEGENIHETIMRIASIDYPAHKFNIIAVNDGSTDNTLSEMERARLDAKRLGVEVIVIDWQINRGKRDGMAECVKKSTSDIVIFIDSDSFVEKNTARELIKYFIDPKVAAVAGHAYVTNAETNVLTKMQAIRYYISFKAYKASEALFGSVMCCSGCCSAYRRDAVLEVIDQWLHQYFLGVRCTYGDDRSLTNFLLRRNYKALFAPEAICHTAVPDTFRKFMKQQLRWKKSWFRENVIASTFIWKKNPIMSISFYLGFILPILAPVVVIRTFIWYPYEHGQTPLLYLSGMLLMSLIYGLYYLIYTRDRKWVYGVFFSIVYAFVLIWQLPWAILTIRDTRWGTR